MIVSHSSISSGVYLPLCDASYLVPSSPLFAARKLRWNHLAHDSIKLGFEGRWSTIGFQGKVEAENELLG